MFIMMSTTMDACEKGQVAFLLRAMVIATSIRHASCALASTKNLRPVSPKKVLTGRFFAKKELIIIGIVVVSIF
jgi:hypothetical protein